MSDLTKNQVILQLANLAAGIERAQGDKLKAQALREAISIIDEAEYQEKTWSSETNILRHQNQRLAAHIEKLDSTFYAHMKTDFDGDFQGDMDEIFSQTPETTLFKSKAQGIKEFIESKRPKRKKWREDVFLSLTVTLGDLKKYAEEILKGGD